MSRKSLLAIRRGRRVARTFTFDSDILPSSPMEANANLTLTLIAPALQDIRKGQAVTFTYYKEWFQKHLLEDAPETKRKK